MRVALRDKNKQKSMQIMTKLLYFDNKKSTFDMVDMYL